MAFSFVWASLKMAKRDIETRRAQQQAAAERYADSDQRNDKSEKKKYVRRRLFIETQYADEVMEFAAKECGVSIKPDFVSVIVDSRHKDYDDHGITIGPAYHFEDPKQHGQAQAAYGYTPTIVQRANGTYERVPG